MKYFLVAAGLLLASLLPVVAFAAPIDCPAFEPVLVNCEKSTDSSGAYSISGTLRASSQSRDGSTILSGSRITVYYNRSGSVTKVTNNPAADRRGEFTKEVPFKTEGQTVSVYTYEMYPSTPTAGASSGTSRAPAPPVGRKPFCPTVKVGDKTYEGKIITEQGRNKCGYVTGGGVLGGAFPLRQAVESEAKRERKPFFLGDYNFNVPQDDWNKGESRKTTSDRVGGGTTREQSEGSLCDRRYGETPITFVCGVFGSFFSLELWWWISSWFVMIGFLITSVILALAVYAADGAIYYFVILAGQILNNPIANDGILMAWAIVRDFANIAIIFGFIAVGISTILDVAQYAASKFLARLIIAALLVNFSYFLTGAVIDSANYISVAVYNSNLFQNGCAGIAQTRVLNSPGGVLTTAGNAVISGDVRRQLCPVAQAFYKETNMSSWSDIQNMAASATRLQAAPTQYGTGESRNYFFLLVIIGILGIAFTAILAFVMMNLAYMLVVRFIVLVVLLITSPIGIAGINVPFLESAANRWWSALLGQAFFVPVMLFLLAAGITVLKGFNAMFKNIGSEQSFAQAIISLQNSRIDQGWMVGLLPVFLTFAMGVGFIFVALYIGRQITEQSDFKPLYGMAQTMAWNTLRSPILLPAVPLNLLMGLINQSRLGAWLMKDGKGWRGQLLGLIRAPYSLLAGASRQATRLGSGKKEEKGVFEAMQEEVKAGREYRAQKALDRKARGTDEEAGRAIESMEPAEAIEEYGIDHLIDLQKKGYLSSDYFKKVRDSAEVSKTDKDKLIANRFNDIMKSFNNKNWAEAAKKIEGLDETERKILFEERKELRNEKELLALLKGKTFDEIADKSSDGKAMRGLRKEAMATRIAAADDGALRDIGKSLSNKDLLELNVDQVRKLGSARALSASQIRHIYQESHDKAVTDYIRENHSEDLEGPGFKKTAPTEPQEPPPPRGTTAETPPPNPQSPAS